MTLWVIIALSTGFVFGLVLLIVGLRGRRVGDEPRCRKCSYDLTGLDSNRCPECGTTITLRTTVRGMRHRRKPALIIGLMLTTVTTSIGGFRTYTWFSNLTYGDYPVVALKWLVRRGDGRARLEIRMRALQNQLAPQDLHSLFPFALSNFTSAADYQSRWAWYELLDIIHAPGVLTDAECRRLYDVCAQLPFRHRPRIRQGEMLIVRIDRHIWTFNYPAFDALITECEMTLGDSEPIAFETREWPLGRRGSYGIGDMKHVEIKLPPGTYPVVFRATKTFYKGEGADRAAAFETEERTESTIELLPAAAPDTLQLVDDPSLAQAFRNALNVRVTLKDRDGRLQQGVFHIDVNVVTRVPMDSVFIVALVGGEKDLLVGLEEIRASGAPPQGGLAHCTFDRLQPGVEYTPVLRPSAKYARLTTDIFRIWNGELRYEPFTLESLLADDEGAAAAAPVAASAPNERTGSSPD